MNAKGFNAALEQLGWTTRGVAYFFDVGERTIHNWIASDHIPRPVNIVLRVMIAKKIDAEEALTIAGVRDKQVRFIVSHLTDNRVTEDEE